MTIGDFLLELSVHPKLAEEFYDDPEAVLGREEFGLSPRDREILLSGDLNTIQDAVFAEDREREISIRLRPVKGWPVKGWSKGPVKA
jgi:hypothetical protein